MRILSILSVWWLCGCSTNNLFLGKVYGIVGTHRVTVTDCYRFRVDSPKKTGNHGFEFTPCRDAHITIINEELTVNEMGYGRLSPGDRVLVEHGVVWVQRAGERLWRAPRGYGHERERTSSVPVPRQTSDMVV